MDLGLDGKRALITGSTAGIGFATAEAFAREGAHVIVNGRTQGRVESAVSRLRKTLSEGRIEGIAADVSGAEGCERVIERYPDLDVLVNNMGIFEPRPFAQISDADWLRFFESNVLSGVRLSRHYVAGMRLRNWGRIVFVSSESALQIPVEMIHYGVTKTAQIAVARGLAETLAGTNVTVNSVLPGPTASEGVAGFVAQLAASSGKSTAEVEEEFFRTARPSSVLQRFAAPAEVAALITYVCSVAASATTGAALRADGGVVRSIV
jgi:NAD(P)-dependent dehydrogenase (short-subunit alcohol dehydrogenase family)